MDVVSARRRAAIYCRISQDREGAGLGVERQRADCEALASKLGFDILDVYTDNDVSAYSGKPRPQYARMLRDLDAGKAAAVIVWHNDRLHRSPRELEDYIDLCERRKITTATVQAGSVDLATSSGRMVARMLGAAARQEVEHKSDRIKRAQAQAAQAGKWLGGAPPLGWNLRPDGTATLDRVAAGRIRRASADVLAGASLGSIVAAWNDARFTTSTGRPWSYATVRQVLTRARNAALVEYNGQIVAPSTWPAIVTEDTWRALCAMLADPTRRKSLSNRARWLLAGIATCGKPGCGAPLRSATATSANTRRIVYRCTKPGTGHVARAAAAVDDLVDRVVRARLARPDVIDLLADSDAPDLADEVRAEATALRVRLADYQARAAEMNPADFAAATHAVRDKLGAVESQLAATSRTDTVGWLVAAKDPVKAWAAASIERQRGVVRTLLDVTVLPLPTGASMREFDPELVKIEWTQ